MGYRILPVFSGKKQDNNCAMPPKAKLKQKAPEIPPKAKLKQKAPEILFRRKAAQALL